MWLCRKLRSCRNIFIMNYFIRYCPFLLTISPKITPALLRWCGVKVGKGVYIATGVYIDARPWAIELCDGAHIAMNVQILMHKRDMSNFKYGSSHHDMHHIEKPVKLCNNCFIGMGAILTPGVTVGEGSLVAIGAVVTKDVPPWTVVAGCPAKPIRKYLPDGTSVKIS